MTQPSPDERTGDGTATPPLHGADRRHVLARVGEDWWATIAGLTILALVLLGVIPIGLVP